MKLIVTAAAFCLFLTADQSISQTVDHLEGTLHQATGLSTNVTSAPSVAGSIVTITFQDESTAEYVWSGQGDNVGGVQNDTIELFVAGDDIFDEPWSLENVGTESIVAVELYLAPGRGVFDVVNLKGGGTSGSGGGTQEFELYDGTDLPFESVSAEYSDIVAIGSNPAVGDLFCRLKIAFSTSLKPNQRVVWGNDLDSTSSDLIPLEFVSIPISSSKPATASQVSGEINQQVNLLNAGPVMSISDDVFRNSDMHVQVDPFRCDELPKGVSPLDLPYVSALSFIDDADEVTF